MMTVRRLPALLVALVWSLALTLTAAPLAYAIAGDLDPAFGSGGIVTSAFGPGDSVASAIAIQADGKIVVGGYSYAYGGHFTFALARYADSGALDPSFGAGGFVSTDFGPDSSNVTGIAIQSDGKIVATGFVGTDSTSVN